MIIEISEVGFDKEIKYKYLFSNAHTSALK